MKHKRCFLLVLVVLMVLPVAACGEKEAESFTIGVVNLTPLLDYVLDGFKAGMSDLGYTEGDNLFYVYQGPVGVDELEATIQSFIEEDVDLILALSTPAAQAAKRVSAGSDVPVVFVPITDPIAAGLVDSLMHPGGNLTGIAFGAQEPRRLEWLIKADPTIEQIYVPYNPDDPAPVAALETVSETAVKLGVELVTREVRNDEEVIAGVANIPEEADAIFTLPDSLVTKNTDKYIEAAIKLRLPFSGGTTHVEQGALIAYGMDLFMGGRQAAHLADQILQGADPGGLPVETAEFFLMINLKTADAIGLEISDDVLEAADTLIR
jgi:putative ABC transport system substrate-binding protein